MSFYTEKVTLCPLENGLWSLASDMVWEIGKRDSGHAYTVPAGFITDLASIPRLARWIFDRGDARLAKAAILHDHMLVDQEFSRLTASAEFTAALLADGVPRWQAFVMGFAVLIWTNR